MNLTARALWARVTLEKCARSTENNEKGHQRDEHSKNTNLNPTNRQTQLKQEGDAA